MAAYKNPTFQERAALAAEAKKKALDKLKAKPPIDPAVLAERQAARLAREAKEAEERAAKKAAAEQAKADKAAEAERLRAEAEAAKLAKQIRLPTEAERKAMRDARYAARKARK